MPVTELSLSTQDTDIMNYTELSDKEAAAILFAILKTQMLKQGISTLEVSKDELLADAVKGKLRLSMDVDSATVELVPPEGH